MRAASCDGPKQAIPAARTASATPKTKGTSGPITTRSASTSRAKAVTADAEVMSMSRCSATAAVPALPGAITRCSTLGSLRRARSNACSRAPEPITRTRMGVTPS
nr:hypothetical protein CPGR_00186 [Mycolicibacter nonchromogenicus]